MHKRACQRARRLCQVKIIHRLSHVQITVGIKPQRKIVAVVFQITFHLKFGLEFIAELLAVLQPAAELQIHALIAQVSDVTNHSRHRQPGVRLLRFVVIRPLLPMGIGIDGLPPDFAERDEHGAVAAGCRQGNGRFQALRMMRRPLQNLHPAHRPAGHAKKLLNAQVVDQPDLRPNHVAYSDHRELQPKRHPGRRIGFGRSSRAVTTAQNVAANHKIAIGVKRFAGTNAVVPPAGFIIIRGMATGGMGAAAECMANEDRVAAVGR